MLSNSPFYFDSIKKYMSVFGALFADIKIQRTIKGNKTQEMTIPLSYANKEKMLVRDLEDPNLDKQAAITLPRMSYEIVGMSYDGDRKTSGVMKRAAKIANNKSELNYQYAPVPYNIDLKLYIYVKNMSDGTKIVEQILPFFQPDYTVTVELIPEMNVVIDVPIIYNNISVENTTSDLFEDRQIILWTLNFTLKGQIYGPIRTQKIIKFVLNNIYNNDISDKVLTYVTEPGMDANGAPTTNVLNSIDPELIGIDDNYGIIQFVEDKE